MNNNEVELGNGVTEFQGIDLDKIEIFFKEVSVGTTGNDLVKTYGRVEAMTGDVLELVEHVRNDGLLDRVATARKSMLPTEF